MPITSGDLTVNEIPEGYLNHADSYRVKDGVPTSRATRFRQHRASCATNVFRPRERLQDPSPSRFRNMIPASPSLASELDCVKTTLFEYKAWR